MVRTQEKLKSNGVNITNADLQALLWYYEKDLYKQLGYTPKRAESADYADAARQIFGSIPPPADAGGAGRMEPAGGPGRAELGRVQSPGGSDGQERSRRSPASPGLSPQQSPLNNRGGLQVKFATGHSAIRVNGKSRFKVFSPLKRFLSYAKSVEDVEKLLLN